MCRTVLDRRPVLALARGPLGPRAVEHREDTVMHLVPTDFPTRRRRRRHCARRQFLGAITATGAVTVGTIALAAGAGAGETVWDRVAMCESSGNWHINTGNGYYGGLQFSYTTWKEFGGQRYAWTATSPRRPSRSPSRRRSCRWQGPGAWPVCSERAGLTVKNGLASTRGRAGRTTSRSATRSVIPLEVDGIRGPRRTPPSRCGSGARSTGRSAGSDVSALQRRSGGRRRDHRRDRERAPAGGGGSVTGLGRGDPGAQRTSTRPLRCSLTGSPGSKRCG